MRKNREKRWGNENEGTWNRARKERKNVCVCDGNYSVINLERLKKQRKIDSIKNNEFHGRKVRWFKKRAKNRTLFWKKGRQGEKYSPQRNFSSCFTTDCFLSSGQKEKKNQMKRSWYLFVVLKE